jgi:hypothetical protein
MLKFSTLALQLQMKLLIEWLERKTEVHMAVTEVVKQGEQTKKIRNHIKMLKARRVILSSLHNKAHKY